MKKIFLLVLIQTMALTAYAQKPIIKVDISEYSRTNTDEILEPGFTWWRFRKDVLTDTLVVDGIKCIVSLVEPTDALLRGGWNKAFVQNTEAKAKNSRLTGDGVNIDPNVCGTIVLRLEGLPKGKHTIQTYHNGWANPATTYGYPITIKCNGEVVHENINRTFQEPVAANATLLTTSFNIANDGDAVELSISTSESNPPTAEIIGTKTSANKTPLLNGFELNTVSVVAQAKNPDPTDANYHVATDEGFYLMKWSPASTSVTEHRLFLGTDSATVAEMTTPTAVKQYADTTYQLNDPYNLNTYYWRVDEVDDNGTVTPGVIWSFRPRHLAFADAEGYGRFATGGRGGEVYHVTTLEDNNQPGSFRYGATQLTTPQTIVFDVSGIITLKSRLVVNKWITIAGQTAPGKGICFRSSPMGLNHESICRFVRMRLGYGDTADGIGMGGVSEGIMDHCSISWTIDESFSSRNAKNITLQRTLISEALSVANHKNYEAGTDHGFAGSVSGDIGSLHHNLLAHNSGRNWSLAGGLDGAGFLQGRLDIFNMVVYNWRRQACYNGAHEVNFVNNYYKRGPATIANNSTKIMLSADAPSSKTSTQKYYFRGNIMEGIFDESNQEKGRTPNGAEEARYDTLYYKQWVDEPFFPSYAKIQTASEAFKNVLSNVGCNMPQFDDHDKRVVDETLNGTYHFTGSEGGKYGLKQYGIIDRESDCGGYEVYPELQRDANYDQDADGIPTWFETIVGTDPETANNNADPDHDGYTQLEDYLEFMAHPYVIVEPNKQATFNVAPWFRGFSKSPVFTIENDESKITAVINDSIITFTAGQTPLITGLTMKVTDSEGTEYTQRVNVAVSSDVTAIDLPTDETYDWNNVEYFDLKGRKVQNMTSHEVYIMSGTDKNGERKSVKILKY